MNDRVLDLIQSGDFRPPLAITEQVLGNLPQASPTTITAVILRFYIDIFTSC